MYRSYFYSDGYTRLDTVGVDVVEKNPLLPIFFSSREKLKSIAAILKEDILPFLYTQ